VRETLLSERAIEASVLQSRQAVRRRPEDLYLRENLLLHAQRLERPEVAEEQARILVAKIPGNYLAHMELGNALLRQDRVGEAIAAYETALELNPFYQRAAHNLMVARARVRGGD
jgi:Flp pilus assembly protein TadD